MRQKKKFNPGLDEFLKFVKNEIKKINNSCHKKKSPVPHHILTMEDCLNPPDKQILGFEGLGVVLSEQEKVDIANKIIQMANVALGQDTRPLSSSENKFFRAISDYVKFGDEEENKIKPRYK